MAYQEDTKEDLEGQVAQLEGKLSLAEETVKGVFLLLCQVRSCLSAKRSACVTTTYVSDVVEAHAVVYLQLPMVMVMMTLPTNVVATCVQARQHHFDSNTNLYTTLIIIVVPKLMLTSIQYLNHQCTFKFGVSLKHFFTYFRSVCFSLFKLPSLLVGENAVFAVFLMISICYTTTANNIGRCHANVMSDGLQALLVCMFTTFRLSYIQYIYIYMDLKCA